MAEVLREYFAAVYASDVFGYRDDYGRGSFVADRLGLVNDLSVCPFKPDWVITNPPFTLAEAFVARGLEVARRGVAVLVRTQWLEGVNRYDEILRDTPPSKVAIFVERVPMQKGRWNPKGSTATAYIWLVWDKQKRRRSTELIWIPPGQRERLSRDDDVAEFAGTTDEDLFNRGKP